MNSVRSNNLSKKYQRITSLGCKDMGIQRLSFFVDKIAKRIVVDYSSNIIAAKNEVN